MKKFALIVAGGSGNRMNSEIPKQFIEINGWPVLMHTFYAFNSCIKDITFILVLPETQISFWKELCVKYDFNIPHLIAEGGEFRFQSVKNGLNLIEEDGIVFIHDGVRPLVSSETINNCLETTKKYGNALPVIPPSESVRFSDGVKNNAVDRTKYYLVQTPQTFLVRQIKSAYEKTDFQHFTDDASVLESFGEHIHLVEGNRSNIKITYPEDLKLAGLFLTRQ